MAKIKPDIYLGLKWKDDEGEAYTSIDPTPRINGKRQVELSESNLLFSAGASHYYAKLRVSMPSGQQAGQLGYSCGYMGKNAPAM